MSQRQEKALKLIVDMEFDEGLCLAEDHYFVFDCPGQVELMTLHNSFQTLVSTIVNKWSYR